MTTARGRQTRWSGLKCPSLRQQMGFPGVADEVVGHFPAVKPHNTHSPGTLVAATSAPEPP